MSQQEFNKRGAGLLMSRHRGDPPLCNVSSAVIDRE
jgi:hypothetical protein